MAVVIESPNEFKNSKNNITLFLAGGISNCPDWQSDAIKLFGEQKNLTILNPRRKNFPIDDPSEMKFQITWEYYKLLNSDLILFWFAKGTLNPIVLYELGLHGNKPIVIGIDPEYERKEDVIFQTELARPDIKIFFTLEETVKYTLDKYIKNYFSLNDYFKLCHL